MAFREWRPKAPSGTYDSKILGTTSFPTNRRKERGEGAHDLPGGQLLSERHSRRGLEELDRIRRTKKTTSCVGATYSRYVLCFVPHRDCGTANILVQCEHASYLTLGRTSATVRLRRKSQQANTTPTQRRADGRPSRGYARQNWRVDKIWKVYSSR